MKCFAIMVILLSLACVVAAQPPKTIWQLEKEFKAVKSQVEFEKVIKLIGETEPKTEKDIAAIGRISDKIPEVGKSAIVKVRDTKLAESIIKEAESRIKKCERYQSEDALKGLSESERKKLQNKLQTAILFMGLLGELNNPKAPVFLKRYIKPYTGPKSDEGMDGTISYVATEALERYNKKYLKK